MESFLFLFGLCMAKLGSMHGLSLCMVMRVGTVGIHSILFSRAMNVWIFDGSYCRTCMINCFEFGRNEPCMKVLFVYAVCVCMVWVCMRGSPIFELGRSTGRLSRPWQSVFSL